MTSSRTFQGASTMPPPPRHTLGLQLAAVCLVLLTLAACAPAISKNLQQQADSSLSFPVLAADPEAHRGRIVILGGVIAQTTPKPGQTELEIVQKPLDYFNEPKIGDDSQGRFLVIADRFLDPLIYRKDRRITVAGEVTGSEIRKLGDLDYRYPVISSRELKLWQPRAGSSPISVGVGVGYIYGGPYGYWGVGPGLYWIP